MMVKCETAGPSTLTDDELFEVVAYDIGSTVVPSSTVDCFVDVISPVVVNLGVLPAVVEVDVTDEVFRDCKLHP